MKKYHRRYDVVEAVQITESTFNNDHPNPEHLPGVKYFPATRHVEITTLGRTRRGDLDDYIVRSISGDLYPLKADIFEKNYQPIE